MINITKSDKNISRKVTVEIKFQLDSRTPLIMFNRECDIQKSTLKHKKKKHKQCSEDSSCDLISETDNANNGAKHKKKHKKHNGALKNDVENFSLNQNETQLNADVMNCKSEAVNLEITVKRKKKKHKEHPVDSSCDLILETDDENNQLRYKKKKHKKYNGALENSAENSSLDQNESGLDAVELQCRHKKKKRKKHNMALENGTENSSLNENETELNVDVVNSMPEAVDSEYNLKEKKKKHKQHSEDVLCDLVLETDINNRPKHKKKKHKKHNGSHENDAEYSSLNGNETELNADVVNYMPEAVDLEYTLKEKKKKHKYSEDALCDLISVTDTINNQPNHKKKHKKHNGFFENSAEDSSVNQNETGLDAVVSESDAADLEYRLKQKNKRHAQYPEDVSEIDNDENNQPKHKKKKHKKRNGALENGVEYSLLNQNETELDADVTNSKSDAVDFECTSKQKKKKHKKCSDDSSSDLISETDNANNRSKHKKKHKKHDKALEINAEYSSLNQNETELNSEAVDLEFALKRKKKKHKEHLPHLQNSENLTNNVTETVIDTDTLINSPVNVNKHKKHKREECEEHKSESVQSSKESTPKKRKKHHQKNLENNVHENGIDETVLEKDKETEENENTMNSIKTKFEETDIEVKYDTNLHIKTEETHDDLPGSDDMLMTMEQAEEREQLSDDQITILKNLHIMITWNLPKLHTIETRISSAPTKEQKNEIEKCGEPVKLGKFTLEEDKIIKKNWKDFCKAHDLPNDPKPFVHLKYDRVVFLPLLERIHFAQYLARGLNNRHLFSVYRRFQLLFGISSKRNQGRFTPAEDQLIIQEVNKHEHPYYYLSKILNRTPQSILVRHKVLLKLASEKKEPDEEKWNKEYIERFIRTIMDVTLSINLEELKHREIKNEEWIRIAELMGEKTQDMRLAWKRTIYPYCFIKEKDVKPVITEVVDRLLEMGINDWKLVNWDELVENYEGWTGLFLYRKIKTALQRYTSGQNDGKFREQLQILKQNLPRHKFKRINVNKLEFINEL